MAAFDYDHTQSGKRAQVLGGAYAELCRRGWNTGCEKPERDFEFGEVVFRFGVGTMHDHIGIRFDDGDEIGFPPAFVRVVEDA